MTCTYFTPPLIAVLVPVRNFDDLTNTFVVLRIICLFQVYSGSME